MILLAFFLGGLSKGLLGLGLPVVVLALIAVPLGITPALAVLVIPIVATNLWQAFDGNGLGEILRRLWPFYLAAIAGVLAGGTLAADSDEDTLLALLGAVLLAYAVIALTVRLPGVPARHEWWMAPASALTSGLMFGTVGNFIVPGILYLEALRLPRHRLVQALGVTFLLISSALGTALAQIEVLDAGHALTGGLAVIPAFLGMITGRRLRHRISEQVFRRAFFIGLAAIGIYMVARALLKGS